MRAIISSSSSMAAWGETTGKGGGATPLRMRGNGPGAVRWVHVALRDNVSLCVHLKSADVTRFRLPSHSLCLSPLSRSECICLLLSLSLAVPLSVKSSVDVDSFYLQVMCVCVCACLVLP